MIAVGDKVILLVTGPHGAGLVQAVVDYVYGSMPSFSAASTHVGALVVRREESEGVTWIHGHDLDSPAARALLVAGTLGR